MQHTILKTKRQYQGFFAIDQVTVEYSKFDGTRSRPHVLEVFERGDAAAVMPYDPVRDEVVWLEQFRIGAAQADIYPWLIETVAGVIEPGETPVAVVHREAMEEAGCIITALEPISSYMVSPGGTTETIHLFCGQVDTTNIDGTFGLDVENEDIRARAVRYEESVRWYQEGKMNSATPLIAMLWLMANRERLRQQWQ
jgi:ADP-ribose pyrophosphatase